MTTWAGILFGLAVFFLAWGWIQQRRAGLPVGRVRYQDVGLWRQVAQPLYAAALGLTGRPDYLVETRQGLIPVEVKSGRTPLAPYPSHRWQALAYCLLVEEALHQKAPFALIRYPGATYRVDFTPRDREALLDLLAQMRRDERQGRFDRSHEDPARCRACGFRQICDQRLE